MPSSGILPSESGFASVLFDAACRKRLGVRGLRERRQLQRGSISTLWAPLELKVLDSSLDEGMVVFPV